MDIKKIKEIIESSLKGSIVHVEGSQGKYSANIIYQGFEGLSTINRHKLVYNSLSDFIKSGELHAISLKTHTSSEAK